MKFLKNIIRRNPDYVPERKYLILKNRKNIIIHHYCPHTFNAGDHFVIKSIRKHLLEVLPDAIFVPKAVANNRGWGKPIGLRGENIRMSNEYADAVIVGGSDQYNNWSPRISRHEIDNLIPPLFLIGLGVSSKNLNSEPYLKDPELIKDILATNRKAALSSVRDEITSGFLKRLGYPDAVDTGCPALYLFNNEFRIRNSRKVALTFPYPLLNKNTAEDKYRILTETIKRTLELIRSKGLDPVITCHDDRDVYTAQFEYPGEKIFFSNYPDDFFEFYNDCLMVIGSRLHATILNSGMGVPNVNINLDLRGKGFSQSFGLENWHIDYTDPDLMKRLSGNIDKILSGDLRVFEEFYKNKTEKYTVFRNFIDRTAEIILSNLRQDI